MAYKKYRMIDTTFRRYFIDQTLAGILLLLQHETVLEHVRHALFFRPFDNYYIRQNIIYIYYY